MTKKSKSVDRSERPGLFRAESRTNWRCRLGRYLRERQGGCGPRRTATAVGQPYTRIVASDPTGSWSETGSQRAKSSIGRHYAVSGELSRARLPRERRQKANYRTLNDRVGPVWNTIGHRAGRRRRRGRWPAAQAVASISTVISEPHPTIAFAILISLDGAAFRRDPRRCRRPRRRRRASRVGGRVYIHTPRSRVPAWRRPPDRSGNGCRRRCARR